MNVREAYKLLEDVVDRSYGTGRIATVQTTYESEALTELRDFLGDLLGRVDEGSKQ